MKIIFTTIIFMFVCLGLRAADLIVHELGTGGSYTSINAAISAASPGDRILVKNRVGSIPWVEDVNIDKSLTLMSAHQDSMMSLQGNIVIEAIENATVTIIGVKFYLTHNYSITTTSTTITQRSMSVNVFNCYRGDIDTGNNEGVILTISGCDVESISCRYGDVIGNDVRDKIGIINSYLTNGPILSDSCYIIGNSCDVIEYRGGGEHVFVKNNKVYGTHVNLVIIESREITLTHEFVNNKVVNSLNNNPYIIAVYVDKGKWLIANNIILNSYVSAYDFKSISSLPVTAYYNHFQRNRTSGLTNNFNHISTLSNGGVNQGYPLPRYTDIDLTRNDLGQNGGPTPYSNYRDGSGNVLSGSARVFHVVHPFYIFQGTNSLNIKAKSYDR